jgi:hypothetical protein
LLKKVPKDWKVKQKYVKTRMTVLP